MQAEKFETKSLIGSGENQSTNIYLLQIRWQEVLSGGREQSKGEERTVSGRWFGRGSVMMGMVATPISRIPEALTQSWR